jgi:hypothetical protein
MRLLEANASRESSSALVSRPTGMASSCTARTTQRPGSQPRCIRAIESQFKQQQQPMASALQLASPQSPRVAPRRSCPARPPRSGLDHYHWWGARAARRPPLRLRPPLAAAPGRPSWCCLGRDRRHARSQRAPVGEACCAVKKEGEDKGGVEESSDTLNHPPARFSAPSSPALAARASPKRRSPEQTHRSRWRLCLSR